MEAVVAGWGGGSGEIDGWGTRRGWGLEWQVLASCGLGVVGLKYYL